MGHTRNAALVGLLFVTLGAIYFAVSRDPTGGATLAGLGIAMAVMTWALLAGSAADAE